MGDQSDGSDIADASGRSDTHLFAVAMQKGGVGKTTVAINVAGALNDRGRDVLFVDIDPQGNATEHLGLVDEYDAQPPSMYDVLTESAQQDAIHDLVCSHDEMDVLPSNIDMTMAVRDLTVSNRGSQRLRMALDKLGVEEYDYVIVDCPPDMYRLTDNALVATQNVLMPALAESTSKRAFELLFDHIELLEADFDISIREIGVVLNRIDVRKNQAKDMIEWTNSAFPDVPVTNIRERSAIQKALEANSSLFVYDLSCDMVTKFEEIADQIERQFHTVKA